jgi:SsrA-binding protein
LNEAFCAISEGEAFVRNLFIPEYSLGTYANHSPRRQRKLLLNRKEIDKWEHKVKEKGLTIVPLKLFLNEKGLAKLHIGLAKGKKLYDKRQSLKEKDIQRDIERRGE